MNEEKLMRKVTIEDLLTLKRAERPAPEFWSRFEQELRAKQLAAIIEKRPWWRSIALPQVRWSRLQLPLGAAAIFAITLLSVREYRQAPSSSYHPNPSAPVADYSPSPGSDRSAPVTAVTYASPVSSVQEGEEIARVMAKSTPTDSVNSLTPEVSGPGLLANESLAAIAESPTPVPLGSLLNSESGFESRGLPARSSMAEPLAQLATPKSVRLRDRYLGGNMPAGFSAETVAVPVDHGMNRLRDRQLRPEDFSRFDARGNSLSIKL